MAVCAACFLPLAPATPGSPEELIAFTIVAALVGRHVFNLLPGRTGNTASSFSLGFVLVFAAMLRCGPLGAILTGVAAYVLGGIQVRQQWYQTAFNAAAGCIQGLLSGLIFAVLNDGHFALEYPRSLKALVAACLAFYFVNTGLIGIVIALCSGESFVRLWKNNYLWTAPNYFGALVSVLVVSVWGGQLPITLLFLSPVIILTYLSYRSYMDRVVALAQSQQQLASLYLATTRSLALAIDAKDRYTHQHILRVQRYAMGIARKMGISGDELAAIETGALLHDIGKIGVPESILLKPGRLTPEEYAEVQEHPRIGAEILEPVPFPWPVLPIVKYHHERWDGRGYPEGLHGEEIPLSARILAVADVYDAMTSNRSYRAALSHEQACAEIRNQAGKQFDPQVVDAFLMVIDTILAEGPISANENPVYQEISRKTSGIEEPVPETGSGRDIEPAREPARNEVLTHA